MQTSELSLAGKLDTGLTKGLCLLFGWLKSASLWLLGLAALADLPSDIFEHDAGLWDISLIELSMLLLLPLLAWRHVRYCRHFGLGFWAGLNRLLQIIGRAVASMLVLGGIFFAFLLATGDFSKSALTFEPGDPVSELVSCGLFLLAVYLAAPSAAFTNKLPNIAAAERVEPTLNNSPEEDRL